MGLDCKSGFSVVCMCDGVVVLLVGDCFRDEKGGCCDLGGVAIVSGGLYL